MERKKRKILSEESTKKLVESADFLKRQERVVDILQAIDQLKLSELEEIKLVDQVAKLPNDSEEKKFVDGSIYDFVEGQKKSSFSKAGIGGVVGASLGGLFTYLIAQSVENDNAVAWASLGAALGGAIGGLLGSVWDN